MSSNADGNTDDTETFPMIDAAFERTILVFTYALLAIFFLAIAYALVMAGANEYTAMRARRDARRLLQRLDSDRDRFLRGGRQVNDGGEEGIELAPLPPARVRESGRRLSMEAVEGDVVPPPPYNNPV
ncbi:hypothetical protein GRF29_19g1075799 [Pseudopithomyces chartarum]|uniref:Uncharacterized protein n=1 Tax=Pseudopithomyces chartarum TaxID=1892770 RepID=A0AAN6M4G6_9PLEO|nr:hypothetical protein GRF29_19g1075799 [Pseudopithomyces chartarum]